MSLTVCGVWPVREDMYSEWECIVWRCVTIATDSMVIGKHEKCYIPEVDLALEYCLSLETSACCVVCACVWMCVMCACVWCVSKHIVTEALCPRDQSFLFLLISVHTNKYTCSLHSALIIKDQYIDHRMSSHQCEGIVQPKLTLYSNLMSALNQAFHGRLIWNIFC